MRKQIEIATFGGGCFWGTEAAFAKVKGVVDTKVGYMGGHTSNPSYEDVVSHSTGHAEVVQVTFDPTVVSYDQLLDLFWFIHDPTQLNRQGNDVGDQYRSVIFTHADEQQQVAKASKARLRDGSTSGVSGSLTPEVTGPAASNSKPIVTIIEPAGEFYTAEEYHQRYLDKNPTGYCHVNLHSVDAWLAEHQLARS